MSVSSKQKLVSVIIPVYNVELYLAKCIESVLGQTYQNLELILVNDGSTDSSFEICKRFSNKDNRIRVISQDNAGLSAARNTGIEYVQGDWIMFVDSDDMLSSIAVELLVNLANRTKADIACGAFSYHIEELDKFDKLQTAKCHVFANGVEAIHYSYLTNHAWGKIYASHLFTSSDIRFPMGRRYEDIATTYRLFDKASVVVTTDAKLYWYRTREDSITATPSKKDISDLVETFNEVSNYYILDHSDSCQVFLATILYQIQRVALLSRVSNTIKKNICKSTRRLLNKTMLLSVFRHLNAPMSKKILLMKSGLLPFFFKFRRLVQRVHRV